MTAGGTAKVARPVSRSAARRKAGVAGLTGVVQRHHQLSEDLAIEFIRASSPTTSARRTDCGTPSSDGGARADAADQEHSVQVGGIRAEAAVHSGSGASDHLDARQNTHLAARLRQVASHAKARDRLYASGATPAPGPLSRAGYVAPNGAPVAGVLGQAMKENSWREQLTRLRGADGNNDAHHVDGRGPYRTSPSFTSDRPERRTAKPELARQFPNAPVPLTAFMRAVQTGGTDR